MRLPLLTALALAALTGVACSDQGSSSNTTADPVTLTVIDSGNGWELHRCEVAADSYLALWIAATFTNPGSAPAHPDDWEITATSPDGDSVSWNSDSPTFRAQTPKAGLEPGEPDLITEDLTEGPRELGWQDGQPVDCTITFDGWRPPDEEER